MSDRETRAEVCGFDNCQMVECDGRHCLVADKAERAKASDDYDGLLACYQVGEMQNAALKADNERLRAVLLHIVECHDARSELYTSEGDCAATLADHARKALV